jgi:hypothetical protein
MSNTQLLYTQWNTDSNGNKISVLIPNEQHKIVNGQILLSQIPDENNKVTITGMSEVKKSQSITSATQYKVDYITGVVNFDSSREGNTITVTQYYGRGQIFIDASRIVTDASGSNIIRTLKELVTENEQAVIDEATRDANEAARLTAEGIRVTSEDTRIASENSRVTAENTRKSNETTRVNNETTRVDSETTRVSNENTRKSNETSRVSVEGQRVIDENTRKSNETTRVNNEAARVTAENNRSSAETARNTAETARLNSESTRVTNEGVRTSNETARGTAETARATAEVTRGTAETARATAETARATAETARQTAETNRVTSFTSIKAAYDAAVASQTNVEVTTARLDSNTGLTYPDLASRINVTELAPVIRETIPSGFVKMGSLDYTYMSTNPNTIKFLDEWVAFVNGFKATITAGTVVTLDAPPVKDAREDLVFLELWLDQTTGAPMNRIRTVAGVDFSVNPEGLRKSGTPWASTLAYAQGGNTSPLVYNSSGPWTTAFGEPSDIGTLSSAVNDKGIYLTGYGTTASKTTLKSLDGYVYAIPLFRIPRRPSCGYMESGEYDKISPLTLGINQQRIINKDRVAHSGDGSIGLRIDGRTLPNLLGTDGDCEDLSKWNKTGTVTLDTAIKLFGNASFKMVGNNDSNYLKDGLLFDSTHKYLFSAHAYISVYTSGEVYLMVTDSGTWNNQVVGYFDKTKLNQWQRKSVIVTGKTLTRLALTAQYGTANFDGICIYDLTALGLDAITDVSLLERQLPYVSGVGSASPVSVKSVGKNLFDKNISYINYGSQTTTKNSDSSFTFTKPATNGYTEFICKVKPNTVYSASCNLDIISGAGGRIELLNRSTNSFNSFGSGVIKAENSISNNDGTIIVRFRPADVNLAGSAKIYNIQLEEGAVATTYEAYQESSLITPAECNDMKSISSIVKDYTDLYARKQVKNVSDWVTLDNLSWSTNNSANGYKGTYAPLSGLTNCGIINASTNFMVIKNNGIGLNISPSAISTSEGAYSANGYLVVSTSNSDTGFTDAYSPSSNDWKAYIYGWKMCHSDGVSPYVPSLVPYTPSTWAEWSNSASGVVKDSTGVTITADGVSWLVLQLVVATKASTKYGILFNVTAQTNTNISIDLGSGANNVTTSVGNNKTTLTTVGAGTSVKFQLPPSVTNGLNIKFKDIRVFELPVGSQIESDFNTLTADQLVAKYLFYGLNPKNWKKVTDGTGQTATLPTASYSGYTPYKMIYQLATPVETDISELIKGRLYANNSMTNFIVDNVMTSVKTPVAQPNSVTNGDFSNGTTGWSGGGSTIAATNNILTSTGNGTGAYNSVLEILGVKPINTHKYYARCTARVTDAVCWGISLLLDTVSAAQVTVKSILTPTQNINNIYSGIITWANNYETEYLRLKTTATYADAATANGKVMEVQQVFAADLTAIFGAGNEPDQAWCDKYLEFGTNYLVTGDVNTTALVLQRDNRESFYGVTKQFAVVPASKYKTGKYELMYKPADGTVLIPDTTFTVGTQTLAMTNNTSVGSLTLADADVKYKKSLDGAIDYQSITTLNYTYLSATAYATQSYIDVTNINGLKVGDVISYSSSSRLCTITSILGSRIYLDKSLYTSDVSTGTGVSLRQRYTDRPDKSYSNILVQNDITQLAHQVSLTGFDNKQMLNKEFDILCRGEFTSY